MNTVSVIRRYRMVNGVIDEYKCRFNTGNISQTGRD